MNKMPVTDFGKNACKWQYNTAISDAKLSINFDILQLEQKNVELHQFCLHFKLFNYGGCNNDRNGNLLLQQHCQVVVLIALQVVIAAALPNCHCSSIAKLSLQ